ncbi:hypothetical protein HYPSUDRAFT_40574 [Hypholoma sublateritium FD-334 SS-4]|uniref:Heterokaryon incompatibility domain-containing protein n=1 Tax=Hypholoma sublateritium (strain FD-334 SS-4) TaxID=945553 RepID=A0A0D2MGN1_HYPSF|nr:hypothetical protein HYPSUDRAFT_40574 [Hypholoma sublateritium FD-334 SS-4]
MDQVLVSVRHISSGDESGTEKKSEALDYSRSGFNPTTEARDLLDAFKRYVVSLVKPRSEQADTESADIANVEKENDQEINTVAMNNPRTSQESTLFKKIMDEAYLTVFNQMPIHMLIFRSDGTAARLGDRNTVWRDVSERLQRELDQSEPGFYTKRQIPWLVKKYTKYAILSHTWLRGAPGEVTYADWMRGALKDTSAGYAKLENFCRVAAVEHGLNLGWMDTVCINKESSSELDESIRSMYKWYKSASVCITYLADTASLEHMCADKWFTRGWTLQELIAPNVMRFYATDWTELITHPEPAPHSFPTPKNDKRNAAVLAQIQAATTMTAKELEDPMSVPISRRMQWAVHRCVTREEDAAYSLMGIFNVSMFTAYGEGGERAFGRLVQEILNSGTRNVLDIANWGSDKPVYHTHGTSMLIPPGLKSYEFRTEANIEWQLPSDPIMLTHLGVHLPVLLMPATPEDFRGPLRPQGGYSAIAITVTQSGPTVHNLLDRAAFNKRSQPHQSDAHGTIFGVLNIQESLDDVTVPYSECFAVLLKGDVDKMMQPGFKASGRLKTLRPIVFELKNHNGAKRTILKTDLHKHGMALHRMYL